MLRTIARRTTYSITGTLVLGGSAMSVYTNNTDAGKGLRRQLQFWSHLTPIIADYYLHTSSNSPYVKFQKYWYYSNLTNAREEEEYKERKQQVLRELHEKHAPELLDILQTLGGLYIKLGQVLSVTSLPIPNRYKNELRALQSNVQNHEDYETVIKPMMQEQLRGSASTSSSSTSTSTSSRISSLDDVFEHIEPKPCGAASIGQAHRAKLKKKKRPSDNDDDKDKDKNDFDVVIKVQYPNASWQVPADIQCLGQFMQICIYAEIIDETSAKLSYEEFSRQFLSELDYMTEMKNLKLIYESSLDKIHAPYHRRNVVVPKVYERLCTEKVITMEYIPGPKMEEEARKQLKLLGINTDRPIKDIVNEAVKESEKLDNGSGDESRIGQEVVSLHDNPSKNKMTWKSRTMNLVGNAAGVDSILWIIRAIRRIILLSQASTVSLIQSIPSSMIPSSWNEWAKANEEAAANAATLNLTKEWIDALFDVHGHQIFSLGCFNADCHPGNILVVENKENGLPSETLGLIDFGQCKQLTPDEQFIIAKFILSIANNESDDVIANNFREMGVKTKKDSTKFLAEFSKLMFGQFHPQHMEHKWHMELHSMDKMLYFPKELSMVYRTSLLLRGLALSLQMNRCISEEWKTHAQAVVDRFEMGKEGETK